MKTETFVYICDKDDYEIEVDVELMEDGFPVGVYTEGPDKGIEITLTDKMIEDARDALEYHYSD